MDKCCYLGCVLHYRFASEFYGHTFRDQGSCNDILLGSSGTPSNCLDFVVESEAYAMATPWTCAASSSTKREVLVMWGRLSDLLLRLRVFYWYLVYRGYRSRYTVSPNFRFNGAGIQLYGSGRIELGEESYVGELCSLQAEHGELIQIGKRSRISHNVRIYTSSAQPDADFTKGNPPVTSGSVKIGNGVWIGANTYIGPGLTIGDNSVVGANSVVSRSVPPSEIWGGVPARLIRVKQGGL